MLSNMTARNDYNDLRINGGEFGLDIG